MTEPLVIEGWRVLDFLSALVDKNLAVYEEDEQGPGRYRLSETVRQYARDRLMESGEAEPLRERHRDHFLFFSEEAEAQLTGPEQARWYERLEAEHENLRAAISWSEQAPEGAEAGLRLVGALWQFWEVRGHIAEGHAHAVAMLGRPGAELRTAARAKALGTLAALSADLGDLEAVVRAVGESLAIYQELGDKAGQAAVLMGMGFTQRDGEAARAFFERSLALRRELNDVPGIAECLIHLGRLAWHQGDAPTAQRLLGEALGLQRGLGNRRAVAQTLEGLADMAVGRGDYGAARPLQDEAAAIYRELGDRRRQADYLQALANQALAQGDVDRARAAHDEAAALCREMDDRRRLSHLSMLAGHLLLEQGDFAGARARYEEGLAARREIGDEFNVGWALLELGHAAWCQRDWAAARGYAGEAAALFRGHGDKEGLLAALESLGGAAAGQGQNGHDHAGMIRAARLLAAAEGLRRGLRVPVTLWWRRSRARLVDAARESLESQEYARAREEGRAMSLEQAVEYALG